MRWIGAILGLLTLALVAPPKATMALPDEGLGHIVFSSNRTGDWDIYRMNSDGTGLVNLTNTPNINELAPAYSPDGTKIAFHDGDASDGQINVMNADGSGRTHVTALPGTLNIFPFWSPDGTKLTFTQEYSWEIFSVRIDGTQLTNLTHNSTYERLSSWSPDGYKVSYYSTRDGNAEIYILDIATGVETRITHNPYDDAGAVWRPDGRRMAFYSTRDGDPGLFLMDPDGNNIVQITHGTDFWPRWTSDGTRLVFFRWANSQYDLYTVNPDGTGETRLTSEGSDEVWPSWDPAPPVAYPFLGFFPPVDNPGSGTFPVFNVANAGRSVPVKFSLGEDRGPDIFRSAFPASQRIDCETSAALDVIEETAAPGAATLSYDATSGRYTYVWKTLTAWAGTCRRFELGLSDNSVHDAYFAFKR